MPCVLTSASRVPGIASAPSQLNAATAVIFWGYRGRSASTSKNGGFYDGLANDTIEIRAESAICRRRCGRPADAHRSALEISCLANLIQISLGEHMPVPPTSNGAGRHRAYRAMLEVCDRAEYMRGVRSPQRLRPSISWLEPEVEIQLVLWSMPECGGRANRGHG